MLMHSRRYKIKSGIITAAEIDVASVIPADSAQPQNDIETIVQYYKNNGINTAILMLNSGASSVVDIPGYDYIYINNENFSKNDIINRLKKALEKEKIQLYVSLDCTDMKDSEVLATVDYIHDNYALAGLVIDNYTGYINVVQDIGKILKKGIRKIDFIIQTDDISNISGNLDDTGVDVVIGENMNVHDYQQLKNNGYSDKQLLFHYNSDSMESDIFVLTNFSELDGAVLASYDSNATAKNFENIFTKYSSLPVFGYTMPTKFMVTVPADDMSTYYDGIFVTGTGATDGVVNINGTDYPAQYDGTFGVYVNLEPGENLLTIKSAYGTHTRTVTRKTYSYSSGTTVTATPWDNTVKLDTGSVVKTVKPLTSVLSDPDDDSAIIAGLEPDTYLQVTDSVETKRSGEKTYAYQLSNGGYILAKNVEVTNYITSEYTPSKKNKKQKTNVTATRYELIEQPVISSAYASVLDNGDEVIDFAVNSSPAVFSHFGEDALTLHFLDTEIADISLPQSVFFSDYSVIQQENGVRITMNYSREKQLWGYDISSTETGVKLYLKQSPKLADGEKPLTGVTIMLDAGHGGGDSGALGIAGTEGVWESHLNLAVAQASAALLKEYGADVIMTRNDGETFLELEERRSLVRTVKPDLFISVHHNSMDYSYDSNKAYGSECYYFTSQSKKLADLMCSNVARATNRRDRGEKTGYYYVTRTDIAPSVLMEYSFIINPRDYSKTYSDIDIYRAAWGTVQAVLKAIPQ
ncbi:MAG: N-acetylmuramoyl-L-alanine amidase [Oscillospiraceae bacterium]|nr:N-acetylmuramoyl-L-alanine amidase [Oscillospiraceae bacterium]